MFSTNMLLSIYAAVDERGCGKVDNGYNEASVVHRRQEASTRQPVSFALLVTDMWTDRPFSGVADDQLRSDARE
jgi:hypothetical protein